MVALGLLCPQLLTDSLSKASLRFAAHPPSDINPSNLSFKFNTPVADNLYSLQFFRSSQGTFLADCCHAQMHDLHAKEIKPIVCVCVCDVCVCLYVCAVCDCVYLCVLCFHERSYLPSVSIMC